MIEVKEKGSPKRETKARVSPQEKRRRRGRGRNSRRQPAQRTPKYTGDTDDLKGHIYDIGYNQSDQYTTTTREIAHHVGRTYKHGADVKRSIDELTQLSLQVPTDPVHPDPSNPSAVVKRIWEREVDTYARRKDILEHNLRTLYSLIWGQCSLPLKAKLESRNEFQHILNSMDSLALLRLIRSINFALNDDKNSYQALHEAIRRFYNFKQEHSMSCSTYLEKFQNMVQVIETAG